MATPASALSALGSWGAGRVTLVSCALLILVTLRVPQGLVSDPAWQLRAVQQFLGGQSPSPNHLVQADPADLSRNTAEWITWWAPGASWLPGLLMAAGIPVGYAVRAICLFALVAGSVGWVRWFGLFGLPSWMELLLAAFLPWMHYASKTVFLFSAEILVFGVAPWAALLAWRLAQAENAGGPGGAPKGGAFATGLFLGSVYVLKYSALLTSAGVVAYFAWQACRSPRARRVLLLAVLSAGAALPVVTLSVLNHRLGGHANLVAESFSFHPRVENIQYALTNPPLILGDLDALASYVLFHPVHPLTSNYAWHSWIGVPGALLLFGLLLWRGPSVAPEGLTRSIFFTALCSMAAIWTVSDGVSYDARHLADPALIALPLALRRGWEAWGRSAGPLRAVLAAGAIGYLLVPYLYGVATVAVKAVRRYPQTLPASRLYNPSLSDSMPVEALRFLEDSAGGADDVWYLPEPYTALDLPGRAVIRYAQVVPLGRLAAEKFSTSRPLRLHVLLPRSFEENGKAAVICGSFPAAGPWQVAPVPGSDYVLWTARLPPGFE